MAVSGLDKAFGPVHAVNDVTIDFRAGEVLGLVGENGAGKSTLVALVSGGVHADRGRITIDGREHRALSPHQALELGIAAIRQDPALVPTLSVAENLTLGREPRRLGVRRRQAARRLASEWLAMIDADIHPDALVSRLSPAQRQQVEVAKAVGAGARLAFFDEPTAALGPVETESLFSLIRRLAGGGTSIVYVSHRLEEVFEITTRIAVMRDGLLVADQATSAVTEESLIAQMVGHRVTASSLRSSHQHRDRPPTLVVKGLRAGNRLRGVDLEFRSGEIHGLFGIVGSGRSRLAAVVSGLERATGGAMLLDGQEYRPRWPHSALKAGVVLVPEDRKHGAMFGDLSVATNVVMSALGRVATAGVLTARRERAAARPLVERLNVRPLQVNVPVARLSGGNQQKVVLARALYLGARVLVLDEPTQGVDVGAKEDIHRLIRELADSGIAVIVVSSDLRELLGIADRISVMARGEVTGRFEEDQDSHAIVAAATGAGR